LFSLKGSKKKKKPVKSSNGDNGQSNSIDNLMHLLEDNTILSGASQKTSQDGSQPGLFSSIGADEETPKQFLGTV